MKKLNRVIPVLLILTLLLSTVSGASAAICRDAALYASRVLRIFSSSPRPTEGRAIGGCGIMTADFILHLPVQVFQLILSQNAV